MTEDASAPNPESSPETPDERLAARRWFAEAQELSAAAEYEEALVLLKRIPKAYRGEDYRRIRRMVHLRLDEVEELTSDLEAALAKSKPAGVMLPMLQRLLELKPGDEWVNRLRHRYEGEQQRAESKPSGRRLLRSRRETPLVEESDAEIAAIDQPRPLPDDAETNDAQSVETESLDDLGPIELIPVRPPWMPSKRKPAETERNRERASPDGRPRNRPSAPPRRSAPPKRRPPRLPEPRDEDDEQGMPQSAKIILLVLLFVGLAAISVALGVMLVKGPRAFVSAQPPPAHAGFRIDSQRKVERGVCYRPVPAIGILRVHACRDHTGFPPWNSRNTPSSSNSSTAPAPATTRRGTSCSGSAAAT